MSNSYTIEMLWQCSVCEHDGNRGLKDRYCRNCGHKKDVSDVERMPDDMTRAAALSGEADAKARAGADWVCEYCQSVQNQLSKCCGNCGAAGIRTTRQGDGEVPLVAVVNYAGAGAGAARLVSETRATEAPVAFEPDEFRHQRRPLRAWAAAACLVLALTWLLFWLFTPREVSARVSALAWKHDTVIERYEVRRREGWSPAIGSFDVVPLGMRHHHYDRVHVGSHQESYQDRYACGETCATSSSRTSCRSNSNGTATCTTTPGTRSCSTKYCYRTAYRTVQDYKNVSREQMWFGWKVWDWGYHRTITRSGTGETTTWPTEDELHRDVWLQPGEQERSRRETSYRVTFSEDDDTHDIRPASLSEFQRYQLGKSVRLKVSPIGSVEVLP